MKIIEVKNFAKSFGPKVVHQNVSFDVNQGECLGLIGGSGTGKSVLLRSLIGLERPDSGSICFNQQEITGLSEDQLGPVRQRIAYAFQGGALFDSLSVFDNLAYPLRAHRQLTEAELSEIILKQLKEFGLDGAENLLPSSLSGGMQKRVGLARAMMLKPEVVLYDEPTAGLDPFNTRVIQESILQLKSQGVTSILVTHDMPTAFAVCDRLIFLSKGMIAEEILTSHLGQDRNLQSDSLIQKFIQGVIS